MATDKGFYDITAAAPEAILELAGIQPKTAYQALRIKLLKDKDREIDSFYSPVDKPDEPFCNIEFMGYRSSKLFYEMLHKQSLFLMHSYKAVTQDFFHIAVFTQKIFYDACFPLPRIQMKDINPHCIILDQIPPEQILHYQHRILYSLLPLCKGDSDVILAQLPNWAAMIKETEGSPEEKQTILSFLAYFAEHRFPNISLNQLEKLIMSKNLLEGTRAGEELVEKGIEQATKKLVIRLFWKKYPLEEIVQLTDLSIDEVEKIVETAGEGN